MGGIRKTNSGRLAIMTIQKSFVRQMFTENNIVRKQNNGAYGVAKPF